METMGMLERILQAIYCVQALLIAILIVLGGLLLKGRK
jgi:hypothetical protein